jgi:hypothetical protein
LGEPQEIDEFPDEESEEEEEEWDDIGDGFGESRKACVAEKLMLRTFAACSFRVLKRAS